MLLRHPSHDINTFSSDHQSPYRSGCPEGRRQGLCLRISQLVFRKMISPSKITSVLVSDAGLFPPTSAHTAPPPLPHHQTNKLLTAPNRELLVGKPPAYNLASGIPPPEPDTAPPAWKINTYLTAP